MSNRKPNFKKLLEDTKRRSIQYISNPVINRKLPIGGAISMRIQDLYPDQFNFQKLKIKAKK